MRLIITNMVLENFKSYAGVQDIGPFHKRFSSVVGPNGSGKSNVIDALLFVFGRRAAQLRLKKVSELIHRSSGFPDLQYARVSVHFQQIYDNEESEDDFEVVPNSEFVVTRTAQKDNTSKYSLNDKSITPANLAIMLKGHGIDLDNNRFLILQGEVEQISMMKPKALTPHEDGLLEYLEDIIGSNQYVEAITKTSKELDEINEQRLEKVNRLKIAEKERDNLNDSKVEAEEYMEKEKEIRKKKNLLYQYLENQANESIENLQTQLAAVTEKLDNEKSKVSETEAQLTAINKEYNEVKTEYDSVNHELELANNDYSAYERRDVKLTEDLKFNSTNLKKFQATVTKEAKKFEEASKDAEVKAAQIEKCTATLNEMQESKVVEETLFDLLMEDMKASTQGLREQVEVVQANLATAEKVVSVLQTEKESVQMAIQLAQSRSDKANSDLGSQKEKYSKLEGDREGNMNRLQELEQQSSKDTQNRISGLEKTIVQCDTKEKRLQSTLRSAVVAVEEGKAGLAAQQLSGKGSVNATVAQVVKAAKKGGMLQAAGVRGRLGDLATISPEYDIAISTAAGGMLDYIVVDTAEGGQQCINHLRDQNIGRASFIVLEQMTDMAKMMARKVTTPDNTPRLFDLVQASDPAILPALYMALRDTLVARDLDSAVKIAYVGDRAAWRVVTEDGNMIDTSGSMSGGGKAVRSGCMKLAGKSKAGPSPVNAEEKITLAFVQGLEKQVLDLQSELADCRSRKNDAETSLASDKKMLKTVLIEIDRIKMMLSQCDDQAAGIKARIKGLQSELTLSPEEAQEIKLNEARLIDLEKEIIAKSPNLRSLQTELASLQRQILNAGGPKMSKCQSKIDSLNAQIDMVNGQMSTKEGEAANLQKQAKKSIATLTKAQSDVAKCEEKLAALAQEQREMEDDAQRVIDAVEEGKAKLDQIEVVLKKKTALWHELKKEIEAVKSKEVDLSIEHETTKKKLDDNTANAKKWRSEAEKIRESYCEEQREFNAMIKASMPTGLAATAKGTSPAPVDKEAEDEEAEEMETDEARTEDGIEMLPVYTTEVLNKCNEKEMQKDVNALEEERNKMKASVNISALIEYLKKDAHYKARLVDLELVTQTRNELRVVFEDLRRKRLEGFMAGFGVISLKLKEMYQMITLGGDAELELLDSLDPFSEGIVFSVRPPKKSWKNISNLSGGEKTLSSLALVFALHHYKPTPLYVMDEIDAALDFKNVSIVANYIKDRTKNAQFVIISLRNNMFELADRLVGIYKTNDCTKSVTINPKVFAQAVSGAPRIGGVGVGGENTAMQTQTQDLQNQNQTGAKSITASKGEKSVGINSKAPLHDSTNAAVGV